MKTKLLLALLLAMGVSAFAAEPYRLATVDLRKVFDNYWRTKQADANLKEQAADLEKERKTMIEQFQKGQESYKKLLDSANDPAVASEEREKRKRAAENELLNLRNQEDRIKQFDTTSRTTLGEKQRRVRDQILGEIKDTIKAKSKAANFTMVIDTAAESINNTPIVLFTSAENDLTDVVLAQLNINAPKDTGKPADAKPANSK